MRPSLSSMLAAAEQRALWPERRSLELLVVNGCVLTIIVLCWVASGDGPLTATLESRRLLRGGGARAGIPLYSYAVLWCCCCCVLPISFSLHMFRRCWRWFTQRPLLLDEADPPDTEREPSPPNGATCPPYWANRDLRRAFIERHDAQRWVVHAIQKMIDITWKDIQTRDRHGPVPSGLEVVGVQRVEDSKLWIRYLDQKEQLRASRAGSCMPIEASGDGNVGPVLTYLAGGHGFQERLEPSLNEHYLWHGSSPEGADGISTEGFKISLAGTNAGSMFGRGAYFAECSSKADEYATDGQGIYKGIYAMLLCRVCCGEMFRVLRRDDALITEALASGDYDSVLGDRESSVGTYREFVVYRERQIYPEYVVLYKRVIDETESDDTASEP
eukprot:TRINITY_DN15732_c0_g1_i1.p1 TRINITY_DN15732_c0_g1~~TRINITY_DN15732_c0_g1_i1.p1  ORF type:complete len:387 (-),score=42.38 TRINITY_DN15732_c0_g1_i1:90-1250(-)